MSSAAGARHPCDICGSWGDAGGEKWLTAQGDVGVQRAAGDATYVAPSAWETASGQKRLHRGSLPGALWQKPPVVWEKGRESAHP
jgi:hypothetical protein